MKMDLLNLIPSMFLKKKGKIAKAGLLEALKEQTEKLFQKKSFSKQGLDLKTRFFGEINLKEIDGLMLLKVVALIFLISYAFYGSLIFSIFLSPLMLSFLKEELQKKKANKDRAYLGKFKEALLSISFALDVGYSIENSFKEAYKELEKSFGKNDEITKDFKTIVLRLESNENIEDLLTDFATKSENEDINYFAEVFRYAKRTGGNLIEIIKNTTKHISEKWAVSNEIKTMISAKKMEQKIMSYIPIVIIFYLKLTAAGYLDCLYFNPLGIIIMTISLIIYAISVLLSKKIMDIEI